MLLYTSEVYNDFRSVDIPSFKAYFIFFGHVKGFISIYYDMYKDLNCLRFDW